MNFTIVQKRFCNVFISDILAGYCKYSQPGHPAGLSLQRRTNQKQVFYIRCLPGERNASRLFNLDLSLTSTAMPRRSPHPALCTNIAHNCSSTVKRESLRMSLVIINKCKTGYKFFLDSNDL